MIFDEDSIDICVGRDFSHFLNDLDYERNRFMARTENKVKTIIKETCLDNTQEN